MTRNDTLERPFGRGLAVYLKAPLQARAVALALALATCAVLMLLHVGFQGGDDSSFLIGALGWIQSFPYVGESHWTLRHTVTIPAALSIKMFGFNELAITIPTIAYFIAFLAVNAWFIARYLDRRIAAIGTVLLIVLPGFPVVATYLNCDIPELFFVATAFWLVVGARSDPSERRSWILAGLLLGLAFVNRQTAASAVIFLGLLFLFLPAVPRSRYVLAGAAFIAIIAIDWLYLTLMTGNPTYRFNLDLHHDQIDRFAMVARVASAGGLIDSEGNLSINVFLDPFLVLFASQKYALTFWLALPAAAALWRRRSQNSTKPLLLLMGLGIAHFVFIAANPKLYLVPRYFVIVAWSASVVVAWWIIAIWDAGHRLSASCALLAGIITGLVALSVENTNPRSGERQLVEWVRHNPGQPIHTDPVTAVKAQYFFRFAGLSMDTVSTEAPGPGDTVYYSADRVAECERRSRCGYRARDFQPSAGWTQIDTLNAPPRAIGRLVTALGLENSLPRDIARRLTMPGGSQSIFIVEKNS